MSRFSRLRAGLILTIGAVGAAALGLVGKSKLDARRITRELGPTAPVLTIDGVTFRDLNKNGRLDAYEDTRLTIAERVTDLLGQMTLEEKCGLMMQPMINAGKEGTLVEAPSTVSPVTTAERVADRHINHFNLVFSGDAAAVAKWNNNLQRLAERTRLGIPVTVSTDPRHSTGENPASGILMNGFSQWPDPLGLAATRDEELVQRFGDVARREYLAVGIRTALHPMADLATEPRWSRMSGTFGEDAELAAQMTVAYIRGFQGVALGAESVSCMVKHFPGGGPQEDGLDPHFLWGKEQVYPGDNFEYHLTPFVAAFDAGVEQVMPYYGIPVGQTSEDVAMGFNKDIITGLLRERFGFHGVVCTDWQIAEGPKLLGGVTVMRARAWGVEDLSVPERYAKAIAAGVDQFGGQESPHHLVELVRTGIVTEARIDESVRRILTIKFKLGLFDDPYVDAAAAGSLAGTAEFREMGLEAQRQSVVLLENGHLPDGSAALPLRNRPRLYVENVAADVAERYGTLVEDPAEADVAVLRLRTPYQPKGRGFLSRLFHHGDLDFKGKELERILGLLESVPTIVDIHLERAAVIPEIAEAAAGLLATFGVTDEILMEAVFGAFNPTGKLPIELPSSMEAVRAQKEDVPYDSEDPLFEFGHGLSYA
jgi:beta-glucosidase